MKSVGKKKRKEERDDVDKHAKTEIASGLAYLIVYFGALLHMVEQGDWLSATIISIGTVFAIIYGIEHLRSKQLRLRLPPVGQCKKCGFPLARIGVRRLVCSHCGQEYCG